MGDASPVPTLPRFLHGICSLRGEKAEFGMVSLKEEQGRGVMGFSL